MSYVCFLCSNDVYEAEKKLYDGKTFHGVCFGKWKKRFLEKEAADMRNAEYYKIPDVSTTKIRESNYNTVIYATQYMPQGTQPNSIYLSEPSASANNKASTSPTSTASGSTTPRAAVPSVSVTVPPHPLVSSGSNALPSAFPHTPIASHQKILSISQPVPSTVSEEVTRSSTSPPSPANPKTWRPRSQSVTDSNPTPTQKPSPEHATLPAMPIEPPLTASSAPSFGSKTSPKVPVRPTSMALPIPPISPKTASRSWPKRNSAEAPIDPATINPLPSIPENLTSYTPPSGNQWASSAKRKPRCSSLPVTRADKPISTPNADSATDSTTTSTTIPRNSWGRENIPPSKPRTRNSSDPTPTANPRAALTSSQPWQRSTVSAPTTSTNYQPKFTLRSHTEPAPSPALSNSSSMNIHSNSQRFRHSRSHSLTDGKQYNAVKHSESQLSSVAQYSYPKPQHTKPNLQQSTSQQSGPQYSGPQHSGPQHSVPQHSVPQHSVPQHSVPQHSVPQHSVPQHSGSQHSDPQHSDPPCSNSQGANPQRPDRRHSDPQRFGHQFSDPQHLTPQHSNSQSQQPGEQNSTPHHAGHLSSPQHSDTQHSHPPQHYDPQHSDPQHSDSQHSDPQHSDPQHSDPRHSDPQHSDPQHSDPQHSDPQHSDPQHSDPQHSDPQHSDPQHSDPQHSDPQHSDPQHSDPQHSDPQHSNSRHSDLPSDFSTQSTHQTRLGHKKEEIELPRETEIPKNPELTSHRIQTKGMDEEDELERASRSLSSDEVSSLYAEVVHFIKPYDLPFSPTVPLETHGVTVVKPEPTFATTPPQITQEIQEKQEPVIPPGYSLSPTHSPFQPFVSPRKEKSISPRDVGLSKASHVSPRQFFLHHEHSTESKSPRSRPGDQHFYATDATGDAIKASSEQSTSTADFTSDSHASDPKVLEDIEERQPLLV